MKRSEGNQEESREEDEESEAKRPPPQEGRCSFWLRGRHRYCHMQRTKGSAFCAEHSPNTARIPCPRDPHHTVDPAKLEKHLRKCPGTRLEKSAALPYFRRDANLGDDVVAAASSSTVTTASEEAIEELLARVRAAFPESEAVAPAPLQVLRCAQCDAADPLCSAKHGDQHSSLVAHMLAAGMIRGCGAGEGEDSAALVEMGAGRGRLSYVVARCCPDGARRVLLVDRGRFRHAVEHARKQPSLGDDFKRVLIDIKDIDLARAPLCERAERVTIFGKHLCGAACDMALRCADAWPRTECSVAIALCCFHRVEWRSYVGKEWLARNGFGREDFDMLRTVTSWNTGTRTADGGFSNPEKQRLGRMARHILVAGRVAYLRERGFDARVVQYVEEATSPENLLLLATKLSTATPPAPAPQ